MYTHDLHPSETFDRVATLDIETTGFDGTTSDLVAIGVGYYETGQTNPEIEVISRGRTGNDEVELIAQAFEWINRRDPPGLVTYNGRGFDFPFLSDRLGTLGVEDPPGLELQHVDLFPERKQAASLADKKWPSLEDCLAAYDLPVYETLWDGEAIDNTRFGESLAPLYLSAVEAGEGTGELERVIHEYTASDIEANIALYEADVGREYTPAYQFSFSD